MSLSLSPSLPPSPPTNSSQSDPSPTLTGCSLSSILTHVPQRIVFGTMLTPPNIHTSNPPPPPNAPAPPPLRRPRQRSCLRGTGMACAGTRRRAQPWESKATSFVSVPCAKQRRGVDPVRSSKRGLRLLWVGRAWGQRESSNGQSEGRVCLMCLVKVGWRCSFVFRCLGLARSRNKVAQFDPLEFRHVAVQLWVSKVTPQDVP